MQDLSIIIEAYLKLVRTLRVKWHTLIPQAFPFRSENERMVRHQLFKERRGLLDRLHDLKRNIPAFLSWEKQPNDCSPAWLKIQRLRLRSQYESISAKLAWSLAHLSSTEMGAHFGHGEIERLYAASHDTATTVLVVAKESYILNCNARNFYHSDCIRATTLLLQTVLRNSPIDRARLDKFISSCRDGIGACRSLIPKVLARTEDTIDKLLNKYISPTMTLIPRCVEQMNQTTGAINLLGPQNPETVDQLLVPVGPDNAMMDFFFQAFLEDPLYSSSLDFDTLRYQGF